MSNWMVSSLPYFTFSHFEGSENISSPPNICYFISSSGFLKEIKLQPDHQHVFSVYLLLALNHLKDKYSFIVIPSFSVFSLEYPLFHHFLVELLLSLSAVKLMLTLRATYFSQDDLSSIWPFRCFNNAFTSIANMLIHLAAGDPFLSPSGFPSIMDFLRDLALHIQ